MSLAAIARQRRARAVALVIFATAVQPRFGNAQPSDGAVEITVVGAPGDLQRVRGVVESRSLAGPGTRWARLPRFDPMDILHSDRDPSVAPLRCWIDVVDPRRARLYFAARSGEHFLVRDVEMSGTFDEVDREALSQVIELSVAALLENERDGLTRTQTEALLASREKPRPPPVAAPQTPAPPEPAAGGAPTVRDEPPAPIPPLGVGPTGGAFYRAQVQGPDLPVVHGPGLAFAWGGWGPRQLLGGWVTGQYQLPAEEVGPAIGMRFETFAARAGAQAYLALDGGADIARGPRPNGIVARVGVGTDLVRVTPRPGSAGTGMAAVLTPPRWSSSLVFGATAAVTWKVGRRAALGAVAALDLLPTTVHYDLRVDGRASAVFSPWRLRPGLGIELLFR